MSDVTPVQPADTDPVVAWTNQGAAPVTLRSFTVVNVTGSSATYRAGIDVTGSSGLGAGNATLGYDVPVDKLQQVTLYRRLYPGARIWVRSGTASALVFDFGIEE